jgi:hypothetical protein
MCNFPYKCESNIYYQDLESVGVSESKKYDKTILERFKV